MHKRSRLLFKMKRTINLDKSNINIRQTSNGFYIYVICCKFKHSQYELRYIELYNI